MKLLFEPVFLLFNIGGGELMVVLLFVLMFFGSKNIPDLARGLGRAMREMKDAMNGVQSELTREIREAEREVKKTAEEINKEIPKTQDFIN